MGHLREQDRALDLQVPERANDRAIAVRIDDIGVEGRVDYGIRFAPAHKSSGCAIHIAVELLLPVEHTDGTVRHSEPQPAHDGPASEGEHTHDDGESLLFEEIYAWRIDGGFRLSLVLRFVRSFVRSLAPLKIAYCQISFLISYIRNQVVGEVDA